MPPTIREPLWYLQVDTDNMELGGDKALVSAHIRRSAPYWVRCGCRVWGGQRTHPLHSPLLSQVWVQGVGSDASVRCGLWGVGSGVWGVGYSGGSRHVPWCNPRRACSPTSRANCPLSSLPRYLVIALPCPSQSAHRLPPSMTCAFPFLHPIAI